MKKGKKLVKDTVKISNKRGQALVEFVLLLPVIFLVAFTIFDVSSIFYNKNRLEGILNDVAVMVENKKTNEEIINVIDNKDITYNVSYEGNYATISLKQKVVLPVPALP